jgi:dTDP-glucose pyrophosphorylase
MATLVIMAAGLASRYGGAKQIEKVGTSGEILMEYTIHDAQKAGFDHFVIVLQPGMLEDFKEVCGGRLEKKVNVDYAFQSYDALPGWYTVPEGRTKPYGTVPAVLSGKNVIRDRFAVVNADDYYGPGAYTLMYETLQSLPEEGVGCMVAYKLKNTVSDFGTVTRGVCTLEGGKMTAVEETYKIGVAADGSIRSYYTGEEGVPLDRESAVSMNFWGFTPSILREMEAGLPAFLTETLAKNPQKGEYLLPKCVDELIKAGRAQAKVLTSHDRWYGVTYKEDKESVVASLQALKDKGLYPEELWKEA